MTISFTQSIRHGANRIHLATQVTRCRPPLPPRLAIRTLNVCNRRVFGIAQAVQAFEVGSFDLIILIETKISTTAYCRNRLGYEIFYSTVRTATSGEAHGGVVLVLQYQTTVWSLKLMQFNTPNVAICEVINGTSRTPFIGTYLPPKMLDHLPNIEEDLELLWGQDPIFMGELNLDLNEARNPRSQIIADMLT